MVWETQEGVAGNNGREEGGGRRGGMSNALEGGARERISELEAQLAEREQKEPRWSRRV